MKNSKKKSDQMKKKTVTFISVYFIFMYFLQLFILYLFILFNIFFIFFIFYLILLLFSPREFFVSVLSVSLSLEFEYQQVSSLHDSSQYSGHSQ